jgi:hypothetical protein
VQWGACLPSPSDPAQREIAGGDRRFAGGDFAREDYVVEARFDVSGLRCRPARVTLITSTGARRTVDVPAALP